MKAVSSSKNTVLLVLFAVGLSLVLETAYGALKEERIRSESNREQLQRNLLNSKKWREQLQEIRSDLRSPKMATNYLPAKRLEHLEEYVSASIKAGDSDFVFLGTFKPLAVYTFKEHLIRMLDKAEFEIEIVSPWIQRQTLESIKVSIARFIGRRIVEGIHKG